MKKALSGIMLLFVLGYIGFQVGRNLSAQIETVDALMVTVEDSVFCQGIIVRSQTPVYGGGNITEYFFESGEKVGKGQQIAVSLSSAEAATAFRAAQGLKSAIASAEKAYQSITVDGGVTLDAKIFMDMEKVVSYLGRGQLAKVDGAYSDLLQMVVARDYPRSEADVLKDSIAAMKNELKSYEAAWGGQSTPVYASIPGYFVIEQRGVGGICPISQITALSPTDVKALSNLTLAVDPSALGYIVNAYEWYYVCTMSAEDAVAVAQQGAVPVYFTYLGGDSIRLSVYDVRSFDNEAVVTLKGTDITAELLASFQESADIVCRTYSGIKVPVEAIHLVDGQWGVYCLVGATVKFKPIEWTYQGDTYYIVKPASSSTKGLYLYDKIIVSGKNLENNMIINAN